MRIAGKKYNEVTETAVQRQNRLYCYAIFQFLCANEKVIEDEKYNKLYNELFEYFVRYTRTILNNPEYDGSLVVFLAKLEYNNNFCYGYEIKSIEQVDEFLSKFEEVKSKAAKY